jgi:very-short-patch-repair endonuclease
MAQSETRRKTQFKRFQRVMQRATRLCYTCRDKTPSPLRGGVRGGGRSVVEISEYQDVKVMSDPHPSPPHRGEGTKTEFARALRKNATPAERLLWQQLRLLKSEGRHFRRQVPLGKYVADFVCHYPKLVVELDGGQHNEAHAVKYDGVRSKFLEDEGFTVLRFWNADVFGTLEGVVDMIRNGLRLPTMYDYRSGDDGATPTPSLPTGGGGFKHG